MPNPRSDDFIDGLQVAYRAVFHLKEQTRNQHYVAPLMAAMAEIDKEITKAISDNTPKIITMADL